VFVAAVAGVAWGGERKNEAMRAIENDAKRRRRRAHLALSIIS
jgi:hypothetical protein